MDFTECAHSVHTTYFYCTLYHIPLQRKSRSYQLINMNTANVINDKYLLFEFFFSNSDKGRCPSLAFRSQAKNPPDYKLEFSAAASVTFPMHLS